MGQAALPAYTESLHAKARREHATGLAVLEVHLKAATRLRGLGGLSCSQAAPGFAVVPAGVRGLERRSVPLHKHAAVRAESREAERREQFRQPLRQGRGKLERQGHP